ncbi:hypothetical protein Dsin_027949 [Dipteronia sinensis]|uniref:Ankyrin repeat domain-containing protein n=1 Tax=Dipteronia sinensis TaxID=43782 RepID=A0AAD9ZPQ6_9ROSI|nr:hypothetical protein Dsin_027949 [Dipteronia sinensis]
MSKSTTTPFPAAIKPEDYSHSPVHYAVVLGDHTTLTRILSTLPKLTDPAKIHTESDSLSQERVVDQISSVIDRRDVPQRETPLHLAVRLNDVVAARTLAAAGADVSLQNVAGWNPLQEAVCRRNSDISLVLLKLHHRSAWAKWRRRLPRVISVIRRMRDFYMEISFHFESSVIPFVGKIAPSDTYKIWKRDGNLRADTSLAGFDGLKIQRADQSFLFLGDGDQTHNVSPGSLLVLNRDDRKIFDAFENAGAPMSDSDIAGFYAQTSVYRPGMDVTKAELVGRTNWRRQEKTESVGEWKARVYELHNVVFSFRSRKVANGENDVAGSEQVLPLELDEDDDGFLVAENPSFFNVNNNNNNDRRRHSSFVREERDWVTVGRKSVDIIPSSAMPPPSRPPMQMHRRSTASASASASASEPIVKQPMQMHRKSTASASASEPIVKPPMQMHRRSTASSSASEPTVKPPMQMHRRSTASASMPIVMPPPQTKEKEFVKSLRPSVWLTDQFPLKTEELLPLLDILANKVKAVRRLRELLTTKFPPGTFPVKVAIPVVPTVRVVITFTKFVELQSTEQFYTPLSSPRHFLRGGQSEDQKSDTHYSSFPSTSSSTWSSSAWLRRSGSQSASKQQQSSASVAQQQFEQDPFAIPSGYTWTSIEDKSSCSKLRKSKSVRKSSK